MKKRILKCLSMILATAVAVSGIPVTSYAFSGYESLVAGTYTGSSWKGYGTEKKLKLEVTIDDAEKVTSIVVKEHSESEPYYSLGSQHVIYEILNKQTTDVDTKSGATMTGEAIIEAVEEALSKAVPTFSSGDGSVESPYIISNVKALEYLQKEVASGRSFEGQYIELSQDIQLTGEWTPIGTKDAPFKGSFNGKNYTIDGLTVTGNQQYAGLFGYVDGSGTFNNIKLTNVNIDLADVTASPVYAGAVVAQCYASAPITFNNCVVEGSVKIAADGKAVMAGLLVASAGKAGVIANSQATGSVTVNNGAGVANVGGFAGIIAATSLTMNNFVDVDVTVESTKAISNVGGLAGSLQGLVYNNVVVSEVTGETVTKGTVVGKLQTGFMANNYFTGDAAVGSATGKVDTDTLVAKTETEIHTEAFAQTMHDNLSASALATMATKTAASEQKDCTDFASFTDRIDGRFYDWTFENEKTSLVYGLWAADTVDAGIFAGGSGTQEDPYMLSTEEQLRNFAVSLNDKIDYEGLYVALANDIQVSSERWQPIGVGEWAFCGDFDGNGYSVTGITIGSEEEPYTNTYYDAEFKTGGLYYGFFGALGNKANVHDLTLGVSMYLQASGSVYVAGLSGMIDRSTVDNVTVNGTVWGKSGNTIDAANHFSGGLAGMIYRAMIINCVNNADVYGEAVAAVGEAGGIAGISNRGIIINCVSNGLISGHADRIAEGMSSIGAICGVNAGTIVNSYANSQLYSHSYSQFVGSLTGWATGIGKMYNNTYNLEKEQKIENQIVNPAQSVGWMVGPGVNEEGEPYGGATEYESVGVKPSTDTLQTIADNMNAVYTTFPINTTAAIRAWVVEDGMLVPHGEVQTTTYVEPEIILPEVEKEKVTGTFYGRDGSESVILAVSFEESVIKSIEIVMNKTKYDLSAAIQNVIENNGVSALGTTMAELYVSGAAAKAIEKMENNDTSGYGTVDASIFAGGDGTKENPYQIATADQLVAFGASINGDESFQGKYIVLTNDITLTKEWVTAGGASLHPFSGTFDGNGHAIKGLYVGTEDSPNYQAFGGLFAYIKGGVVRNLTLVSPKIYLADDYNTRVYAGTIAASMEQAKDAEEQQWIDNCVVTDAIVSVHTTSGAAYVGGLVGTTRYAVITNCVVDATVDGRSENAWVYGGILSGMPAWTAVLNNVVSGDLIGKGPLNKVAIGGLGGFHSGASYNNVANVNIKSLGITGDVGALAGRNTGIGLMLDGYFNSESVHTTGDDVLEVVGVGTPWPGDRYGKGEVTGLTALKASELNSQGTADKLNSNKEASNATLQTYLANINEWWGLSLPSEVTLNDWVVGETHPVFGTVEATPETPEESVAAPSSVTLGKTKYTFDGKAKKPSVTVKDTEGKTIASKYYSVSYKNNTNAGTATVTVTFKGEYASAKSLKATFTIAQASSSAVTLKATSYTYTGKKITPKLVTKEGVTLASSDYKVVSIKNNKSVGKATVKVQFTGKNIKKTTKTYTFKIVPKSTSVKKLTAGTKQFKVTWGKASTQITGYQVQYATNSKFKSAVTKKVSAKNTSLTVKKLKAKKTYYVRIRTYKTVGKTTYYSAWSKVKTVKTK